MGPTVLTQYWIDQAELVQYYGKITNVSQLSLRLLGGLLCGSSGSGSGSGGSVPPLLLTLTVASSTLSSVVVVVMCSSKDLSWVTIGQITHSLEDKWLYKFN